MKKLQLLVVTVGIVLLVSCGEEPTAPPEEKPFPIGSWRTTHQYFDLTVERALPEDIKTKRERETSVDVAEAESCRLTFYEDGSGYGSGILPDGTEPYDFRFTWRLSDDMLTITKPKSEPESMIYINVIYESDVIWSETYDVEDIIWEERTIAVREIHWVIEESSADAMVLSTVFQNRMGSTAIFGVDETHTYRYTFEKIE
jgi:hypothetical protein